MSYFVPGFNAKLALKVQRKAENVCVLTTKTLVTYLNVGLREQTDMLTYALSYQLSIPPRWRYEI